MSKKKIKRAIGYIRVSTGSQVDGNSLEDQKTAIESYASAYQIELVKIYKDAGISGSNVDDRAGLKKALASTKNIDLFLVTKLDRFARSAKNALEVAEDLQKKNVSLVCVDQGIDFSGIYGKLIFTVLSAIAELELGMIKERVLNGKISSVMKGNPLAGARLPFGRTYDKKAGEWGLDPVKAESIKWAGKQYIAGMSLREISREIT